MASGIAALLRATHLAPSLAVTTMAALLAFSAGRGAGGTLLVVAAVLAGQFSIGWANDWVDRDRDRAAGRRDKPVATGAVAAGTVRACALTALAACVPLSLASGWRAGLAHLLAVAFGWSYDLGLKRTAGSVVPYAAAFGLLPAFVVLGLPTAPAPPWWAVVGGALLGAGAHFTNALPDLEIDARTGVRGLPQRLGAGWSLVCAAALLGAGVAVIALGPGRPVDAGVPVFSIATVLVAGALVTGVLVAGTRRRRLAFHLAIAVALVAVVAFVASGSALAL